MIDKAYHIAKQYHSGQVDKGGNSYIKHPLAVADLVESDDEKIVALLHDIVEDTAVTLENLSEWGFSEVIIKAVDCITKRKNEELTDYLIRVKSNSIATTVKIADLTHNSDISRISTPTEKDIARTDRYKKEIKYLKK